MGGVAEAAHVIPPNLWARMVVELNVTNIEDLVDVCWAEFREVGQMLVVSQSPSPIHSLIA